MKGAPNGLTVTSSGFTYKFTKVLVVPRKVTATGSTPRVSFIGTSPTTSQTGGKLSPFYATSCIYKVVYLTVINRRAEHELQIKIADELHNTR